MTLDEAEEFLFFLRDEMLKTYYHSAELIWKIPGVALEDPAMAALVYRWFYATKPDMRTYIESRILSRAEEVLCR